MAIVTMAIGALGSALVDSIVGQSVGLGFAAMFDDAGDDDRWEETRDHRSQQLSELRDLGKKLDSVSEELRQTQSHLAGEIGKLRASVELQTVAASHYHYIADLRSQLSQLDDDRALLNGRSRERYRRVLGELVDVDRHRRLKDGYYLLAENADEILLYLGNYLRTEEFGPHAAAATSASLTGATAALLQTHVEILQLLLRSQVYLRLIARDESDEQKRLRLEQHRSKVIALEQPFFRELTRTAVAWRDKFLPELPTAPLSSQQSSRLDGVDALALSSGAMPIRSRAAMASSGIVALHERFDEIERSLAAFLLKSPDPKVRRGRSVVYLFGLGRVPMTPGKRNPFTDVKIVHDLPWTPPAQDAVLHHSASSGGSDGSGEFSWGVARFASDFPVDVEWLRKHGSSTSLGEIQFHDVPGDKQLPFMHPYPVLPAQVKDGKVHHVYNYVPYLPLRADATLLSTDADSTLVAGVGVCLYTGIVETELPTIDLDLDFKLGGWSGLGGPTIPKLNINLGGLGGFSF